MELLPASLKGLFATLFEGFPAHITPSLATTTRLQADLTRLNVPYRTKITRLRRKQVVYVTILPERA